MVALRRLSEITEAVILMCACLLRRWIHGTHQEGGCDCAAFLHTPPSGSNAINNSAAHRTIRPCTSNKHRTFPTMLQACRHCGLAWLHQVRLASLRRRRMPCHQNSPPPWQGARKEAWQCIDLKVDRHKARTYLHGPS